MLAPTGWFLLFSLTFQHFSASPAGGRGGGTIKSEGVKEEFLSGLVSTDRSNIFTAALHQVAVTSAPRATSLFFFFFLLQLFVVVQRGAVMPPRCLSGEPSCTPPPPLVVTQRFKRPAALYSRHVTISNAANWQPAEHLQHRVATQEPLLGIMVWKVTKYKYLCYCT